MKIEVEIWSDNHGKDETFGTKPNEPHKICWTLAIGDNVIDATLQAVRTILLPKNPDLPIHVIGSGKDAWGHAVLRIKIAESEFVCGAKIVL